MGPYCKFCERRCFVVRTLPDGSWSGCMATCAGGMAHDRTQTGYDHTTAINPAATCGFCDRPATEWPSKDCEAPQEHDRATYTCDCGDVLTVAEAIETGDRHRRCNLIGSRS